MMKGTGVYDKEGKEIKEGQRVRLDIPHKYHTIVGNGYMDVEEEQAWGMQGVVEYSHDCWFIIEEDGKGLPLDFDEEQQLTILD